jgi:REP-associated tyrosine transposase
LRRWHCESRASADRASRNRVVGWLGEHGFDFVWHEGYAAFSVSASNADTVRHYIEHQNEHHDKHSFEDEFVSLLRESNVDDPQFVLG